MPRLLAVLALLCACASLKARDELDDLLAHDPPHEEADLLPKARQLVAKSRLADLIRNVAKHGHVGQTGGFGRPKVRKVLVDTALERSRRIIKDGDSTAMRALFLAVASSSGDQRAAPMRFDPRRPDGDRRPQHALADLLPDILAAHKRTKLGAVRRDAIRAVQTLSADPSQILGLIEGELNRRGPDRLAAVALIRDLAFTRREDHALATSFTPLLAIAGKDEAETVRVAAFLLLPRVPGQPPKLDDALAAAGASLTREKLSDAEALAALAALEAGAEARERLKPAPVPLEAPAKAVPAAVKLLARDEVRVRLAVLHFLETLGKDAAPAAPALAKLLADPERFVRWGAARALRNMAPAGGDEVVKALAEATTDADHETRLASLQALGRRGAAAKGALPALAKAVGHAEARTRVASLRALASLGKEAAPVTDRLIAALKDDDVKVRAAAAVALGRTGKKDADTRRALDAALDDSDPGVRAAVADALLGE